MECSDKSQLAVISTLNSHTGLHSTKKIKLNKNNTERTLNNAKKSLKKHIQTTSSLTQLMTKRTTAILESFLMSSS